MKKSFAVGFLLLLAVTAFGQGSVHFGNTATTLITTNDLQGHVGNILGAGNYRFGLYLGPFGSSGDSLNLTGLATNGAIAGRFEGGNLVPLAGAGAQFSFQVRGWSSFAGASYEQAFNYAMANTQPTAYLGQSTVGFFTVPASGTIELFGTGPGQVGGFALTPVPEPSISAIVGVGLLALLFLRRRGQRSTCP